MYQKQSYFIINVIIFFNLYLFLVVFLIVKISKNIIIVYQTTNYSKMINFSNEI
ncbi:hypothetical protein NUSPORA_01255 [Nucleospora cyclopteri]